MVCRGPLQRADRILREVNVILIAIALLLGTCQEAKTFEEIELAKIIAFHGLKGFREETEITLGSDGADPAVVQRKVLLDGTRWHLTLETPNGETMEEICDGTTKRVIFHAGKAYMEGMLDPTAAFDPKQELATVEPGSFSFMFNSRNPIQFGSNPPMVVKSIEMVQDGQDKLR